MAIEILMPALSPTMTEGKLSAWLIKEGDTIKAGDVLAEIETDKATMEVEAVDEGVIAKIIVSAGVESIAVNSVIAVLAEEGEDVAAVAAKAGQGERPAPKTEMPPAAVPAPAAPVPATRPVPSATVAPTSAGRIFASPLARRLAKDAGLDLAAITGSGPHGRIVKVDVEAVIKAGPAPKPAAALAPVVPSAPIAPDLPFPFPEGSYELIPNDGMRKAIARRLLESKQTVPHFYLSVDVELDKLLALRAQVNEQASVKVSVNDFIIKASATALQKVPAANATWTEPAVIRHKHADIAVAVAIEGGLITPIVFKAEEKSLTTIATSMKDLALRARDRKLKPEEFQGGTFSISNLGMFGIKAFAAIVNPPHGAILAIGAGEKRPVIKNGELAIATVMTVTLSSDHRVVDGTVGAEFLAAFKSLLENPLTVLI